MVRHGLIDLRVEGVPMRRIARTGSTGVLG